MSTTEGTTMTIKGSACGAIAQARRDLDIPPTAYSKVEGPVHVPGWNNDLYRWELHLTGDADSPIVASGYATDWY